VSSKLPGIMKFALFTVALILPLSCLNAFAFGQEPAFSTICIKKNCITAEIASSDEARAKGLMFRESLAPDSGMIFVFNKEDFYNFWMMNMRISIDIIWIDANNKIVDIKTDVPPCGESCESLKPRLPASYVLETAAGFTRANGISIGDAVSIN